MQWLGANPSPVVSGRDPLPGIVNYFIGSNPAKWHADIHCRPAPRPARSEPPAVGQG
jgi:hypothetical protein